MRTTLVATLAATAVLLGTILPGSSARAADKRILNLQQFTQNDLRALALGNAYGAVARGEGALYYNPAGLAQYDFDFVAQYYVALEGETGKFAQDTYALSNSSTGLSAPNLLNYLAKYENTTQRYNLQLGYNVIANLGALNFGVGAGYVDSYRYALDFQDPNGTSGNVFDDSLTASEARLRDSTLGVAFKLGKGKVLLGVAAKSFKYSEKSSTINWDPVSIAKGDLNFSFGGPTFSTGSAYDMGMLYRLEFWPALKPQWSLTAFNVGGATIKGTDPTTGTVETLNIPASYNLGFAFGPDTGVLHWLVTMEMEDVSDALKVPTYDAAGAFTGTNQPRSTTQRFHAGAEVGLFRTPTGNNILSLRVGNNRGYTTYGWELNLWAVRVLYARGADNLGYKDNVDKFDFVGYQVAIGFAW